MGQKLGKAVDVQFVMEEVCRLVDDCWDGIWFWSCSGLFGSNSLNGLG